MHGKNLAYFPAHSKNISYCHHHHHRHCFYCSDFARSPGDGPAISQEETEGSSLQKQLLGPKVPVMEKRAGQWLTQGVFPEPRHVLSPKKR